MSNLKDKLLQEIGGMAVNPESDRIGWNKPPVRGPAGIYPSAEAVLKSHNRMPTLDNRNLYPWQQEIVDTLSKGSDVFVVAPPGGGKTTPVITYWFRYNLFEINKEPYLPTGGRIYGTNDSEFRNPNTPFNPGKDSFTDIGSARFDPYPNQIYGEYGIKEGNPAQYVDVIKRLIGNPQSFKKLIYVVPIRVLGLEVYYDMVEQFADILLTAFEDLAFMGYGQSYPEFYSQFFSREFSRYPNIVKIMDAFNKQDINAARLLIINLAKELVLLKTGGTDLGAKDPEQAPVICMTYQVLENNISKVSRNVGLLVVDEAHQYQPYAQKQSSDPALQQQQSSSQEDLVTKVKSLSTIMNEVFTNSPNSRMAMLSGTASVKSVDNLVSFIKKRYNRRMISSAHPTAGNQSSISVIADDSLMNEANIKSLIIKMVNQKDWGNCFVILSKAGIDKLVQSCIQSLGARPSNSRTITSGDYPAVLTRTGYGTTFIRNGKIEDIEDRKQMISRLMGYPGAEGIENPDLRRAVSYGIGFIYTEDETSGLRAGKDALSENDKLIVAKLFSDKKLAVLISTSAIGIGVNVGIRRMFLSTTEQTSKIDERTIKRIQMPFRDLAQLVNRTGRSASPIGAVYTPSIYVPYVLDAINANLGSFGTVPAVDVTPIRSAVSALFYTLLPIITGN